MCLCLSIAAYRVVVRPSRLAQTVMILTRMLEVLVGISVGTLMTALNEGIPGVPPSRDSPSDYHTIVSCQIISSSLLTNHLTRRYVVSATGSAVE